MGAGCCRCFQPPLLLLVTPFVQLSVWPLLLPGKQMCSAEVTIPRTGLPEPKEESVQSFFFLHRHLRRSAVKLKASYKGDVAGQHTSSIARRVISISPSHRKGKVQISVTIHKGSKG